MLQPLPSSKVPATPFVPTPVLPSSSTQNSFRVPSSHQQPVHCGMPSSVCTSVPRETVSSGQPSTQVPLYATRAHHQTFNDETQWQMRPSVQNTRVTTYGGECIWVEECGILEVHTHARTHAHTHTHMHVFLIVPTFRRPSREGKRLQICK